MSAREIQRMLRSLGNCQLAEHARRYFKAGNGQYGEGDRFLGIRVPVLRSHVKKCRGMEMGQVRRLLKSAYHEERFFALLLLVDRFTAGVESDKKAVYDLYLSHTRYINNWDLVDTSAAAIVGAYLRDKDKQPIYELATSPSLWERRIAIIATFHMIKNNDFFDALNICHILKTDPEDLIHKAVGWMLREIGKRDLRVEKSFLARHYKDMPRTMLRYAIEKFPEKERKMYLKGTA